MPSQDNADFAFPAFPTHNFRIIITPESGGKKLHGLAGCIAPRHIQGGFMSRSSTLRTYLWHPLQTGPFAWLTEVT